MSVAEANEIAAILQADGRELPLIASVFTPYQLLLLEQIWAAVPARPVLILDSRPERFRAARPPRVPGAQVLPLALSGKVNDKRQAALVRAGMEAAERFAGAEGAAFICSSYQWPINTAFLTRHSRERRFRFLLMEDGLSTFLSVRPSSRERLRNIAREAVARLRGFPPRRMIGGHPLGLDLPEVAGILVKNMELPVRAAGRRYVAIPAANETQLRFTPDWALFLGQPYLATYGPEALRRLLDTAVADLRGRGATQLAFKPHHHQTTEEIGIYLEHGFDLIDPPVAVEEMIAESPYRTIAGINSTALLTLKSLYGSGVRSIAYGLTAFRPAHEGRDDQELLAIFRKSGVEMVDVPPAKRA